MHSTLLLPHCCTEETRASPRCIPIWSGTPAASLHHSPCLTACFSSLVKCAKTACCHFLDSWKHSSSWNSHPWLTLWVLCYVATPETWFVVLLRNYLGKAALSEVTLWSFSPHHPLGFGAVVSRQEAVGLNLLAPFHSHNPACSVVFFQHIPTYLKLLNVRFLFLHSASSRYTVLVFLST